MYRSRTGRSNGPRCRRKSADGFARRFRGRFTAPMGAVRPHNWTNSEAGPRTGDEVLDRLAKEVGNSAYGKIAQGVAGRRAIPDDDDHRRVFDTENDAMRDLGPSRISQPMLAAYITGIVRAAVSEAIGHIGPDHWVGSVTTEAFSRPSRLMPSIRLAPWPTPWQRFADQLLPKSSTFGK